MKIVTIVQARMSSTRLPGKVMLPLCSEPLLFRMLERIETSRLKGTIVVATTWGKEDDEIAEMCTKNNFLCYRGDACDLLDRHFKAGKIYQADTVIKIPSDCPLIDPQIMDDVIQFFLDGNGMYDYVSNLHPATFPDGNDVEIMTMNALEQAWISAHRPFEREHTTPYLWENPQLFKIGNYRLKSGQDYSKTHRWTIDYREDYEFIKAVFEKLYTPHKKFSMNEIISQLEREPHFQEINKMHLGIQWYRHHLNELKTLSQ